MESSRRLVIPAGVTSVVIMTATLLFLACTQLHAAVAVPRILILNSYSLGYDWSDDEMAGFRDAFSKTFPRTELFVEYLDTKKFYTKKHFPRLADLLETKYAGNRLDAIIAMDNAALEFALQYRQRISPGTPLVFCGINNYEPAMIAGQPRITGVAEKQDSIGTLDLALRLHPAVRNVVVIHDYTDTGLAMRRELEKSAHLYPAVKLQFMEEMPLEETAKKLRAITPGHLVLMLSYTVEKGGRAFTQSETARMVSGYSPVPVYAVHAAQLGNGVVGGRMIFGQTQGEKAAEMAARIIGGESPDKMSIITGNLSRTLFDYRVLEKFDLTSAKLPADAAIINKPASTFAINKTAFLLAGMFTLFCTIGLMVLALNVRKRRKLEETLRAQVDKYMMIRDELQATEEMLRIELETAEENSQKFEAVFEHSPITVTLSNLNDGTFREVNQAFIEMFGYPREEAIGKSSVELGIWRYEADRSRYMRLIIDNRYVHNVEFEMRRKSGEDFTVLFSGTHVHIAGKPSILSAVIEITEQKRLQDQLNQSQKMDVVGQLAGGIAHDFNNMLAGIMAAAELLKRRLQNDDKNCTLVGTIIQAATRSADLTRELLTFSRKGPAVSNPVCVHDTISAVMGLLERTIDKQIQLVARLDGDNAIVMGDQTQLQNALLNLGVNARDAMPQGGTLCYATTVKNLDETACRTLGVSLAPGRYLEIAISDTGAGMTKAVVEHIFEPFFTTKSVGKGTGLGLASVYGVVRSHNGEVHVQSEPGVGTIFKMYLPMAQGTAVTPACTIEAVPGKGGILLVDDEEILRDVGRELLEELGYTVYLAEDGDQALDVFAMHRSDISLVLMDMIMPKMGGREAFLKLREQVPELKVLFCSGFSREGAYGDSAGMDASGFIQKPYSRSELSRAVAEALGL